MRILLPPHSELPISSSVPCPPQLRPCRAPRTWPFLRPAGAAPFPRTHLCPVLGACSGLLRAECMFQSGAPTLPPVCLVHSSHDNLPSSPLLLQALWLPVCGACFLSCSLTLGERTAPIAGLLLLVPCGTLLWGQVLPFSPFRTVFIPVLSWEVSPCYMHNEWRVPLSFHLNLQPGTFKSSHPHRASAFSLALVWEVR